MNETIKNFETEGYKLVIGYAKNPVDPRENLNECLGTFVELGTDGARPIIADYAATSINHWVASALNIPIYEEVECEITDLRDPYDIEKDIENASYSLRVYKGIKNGKPILTTETFNNPEVAGLTLDYIGLIFCSKEKIEDMYGYVHDDEEVAKSVLKSEIDLYSTYLRGNITGYKLYFKSDKGLREVDSYSGFIGSNYMENGLIDMIDISDEILDELLNNPCKQ